LIDSPLHRKERRCVVLCFQVLPDHTTPQSRANYTIYIHCCTKVTSMCQMTMQLIVKGRDGDLLFCFSHTPLYGSHPPASFPLPPQFSSAAHIQRALLVTNQLVIQNLDY
jgi:hypothetical protein